MTITVQLRAWHDVKITPACRGICLFVAVLRAYQTENCFRDFVVRDHRSRADSLRSQGLTRIKEL